MPKGTPCKTEAERLASKRAAQARFREKHRERLNAEKCRRRQTVDADKVREYNAAWRVANPERKRELNAAWRAANPDYGARWRAENPDRVSAHDATRRRREKLAGDDLTADQWQDILDEFDYCCAYCQARGVKLEQEHMTPLSRGGRHTKDNVVPACRSCNARKHTKTLLEFAASA